MKASTTTPQVHADSREFRPMTDDCCKWKPTCWAESTVKRDKILGLVGEESSLTNTQT